MLGGAWSKWRNKPDLALGLVMGTAPHPTDDVEMWEWLRSPFPPASEHRDFEILRRSLGLGEDAATANGSAWAILKPPDQARVRQLFPRLVSSHNPFIRRIVRRSRGYLETTIDPSTGEPYLKPIVVELHGERDEDAVRLPPYLAEAYAHAEAFCQSISQRMKGSGFLRTLLLRRVGSTIAAGRSTAEQMLVSWTHLNTMSDIGEGDDDEVGQAASNLSRTLTSQERGILERFVKSLQANQERDPKHATVREVLVERGWLERGCIVFSQYFDSVNWLAQQLTAELPEERIAIYAGSGRSGVWLAGDFRPVEREDIKTGVRRGELRLLLGTDAASEGLNLQRLGTLINLDLPWNPTRLEQRKGRIQRIGQVNDTVLLYNMRYLGSVEDRVHHLLSQRLKDIFGLFGQLPDVLEDAWIDVALGQIEAAKRVIDAVPQQHPFDVRYERIEKLDWESCERVLAARAKRDVLRQGWDR